ncbi:unnamed protein product, partial [Meganyctiphanes norvegica]
MDSAQRLVPDSPTEVTVNHKGGTQHEVPPEARTPQQQSILTKSMEEDILGPEENTRCGLGVCQGTLLQRLAHPATYLVVSSLVALVQGIYFTYSNATLSTVEKRFGLNSQISGFISTGNDVVQLFLSLHISYFAGQGHRPRWLAAGMFLAAFGTILAASPHFIFGSGEFSTISNNFTEEEKKDSGITCVESTNSRNGQTACDSNSLESTGEQISVVTLQFIAQMLCGVASLLYYTVGHSYLDEAVSKEKVPIYFALSGCLRLLGPVCGYSLASMSLQHWVDPSQSPNIPLRHPRWVGAWWIGYLVIGATLLVITWSLLLLPKTMPSARRRALAHLRAAAEEGTEKLIQVSQTMRPATSHKRNGIFPIVKRILKNEVYVLVIANQVLYWFAFFGYITFKAKYLEHQFRMSAAKANQYIGTIITFSVIMSWRGAKAITQLFRPRAKFVILYMIVLSILNCTFHLAQMTVGCNHGNIVGMEEVLSRKRMTHDDSQYLNLESSCLLDCECTDRFSPVCVGGNVTYYSGCHAGCKAAEKINGAMVYRECGCDTSYTKNAIENIQSPSNGSTIGAMDDFIEHSVDSSVVDGYCLSDCSAFFLYLVVTVMTKMTTASSRVPVNLLLFRCVNERDKDVGLGLFNVAIALCSSIPAPILFGWAIDKCCILWDTECGRSQFCWLYDLNLFRYILHGIPAVLLSMCIVTELMLLRRHYLIDFYGDKEKKIDKESKNKNFQFGKISKCIKPEKEEKQIEIEKTLL